MWRRRRWQNCQLINVSGVAQFKLNFDVANFNHVAALQTLILPRRYLCAVETSAVRAFMSAKKVALCGADQIKMFTADGAVINDTSQLG